MTARLTDDEVAKWAGYLYGAVTGRHEVEAITKSTYLSVEDAYRIQAAGIDLRVANGETIVGAKAGLTSKAKQEQMGVNEPIFGVLTDAMAIVENDSVPLGTRIHPRSEPELVFKTARDLEGDVGPGDVLAATASIHAGIEIIDSRFEKFSFTLTDVIADNTSASGYIVSEQGFAPDEVDLSSTRCRFTGNGQDHSATGAALLGDPALCVALLVQHLSHPGAALPAGSVVLAGGMTDAVPLSAGVRISATYADLGLELIVDPKE